MYSNLSDVHRTLLAMLRHVVDVAEQAGIPVYLAYGSALGAVREGGFIPWDSDADVHVFVDDVRRLDDALRAHPGRFHVLSPYRDERYEHLFLRLAEPGVDYNYLHVDLFPLAHAPESDGRLLLLRAATRSLGWVYRARNNRRASKDYSRSRAVAARAASALLGAVPRGAYLRSFDALTSGRRESTRLFPPLGCYGSRELFQAAWFTEPSTLRLDGVELPGPTRPHEYLRTVYGNYEQPVSPEQQRRELMAFETHMLPRLNQAVS